MDTTLDGLLNRRVLLEQPRKGFRVAIDTVLLAAAVDAHTGENVLDIGCGVGGAMLCLASRQAGLTITGIEKQPALVELCRLNIQRNGFFHSMNVIVGDITDMPLADAPLFDQIMMNSPYHVGERHDSSLNKTKSIANTENHGELIIWIKKTLQLIKKTGFLYIIHRADRLNEILGYLEKYFSNLEIIPILPKSQSPAKRVIVRASNGSRGHTKFRPLILHNDGGSFTDEAEGILRHGKPLEFVAMDRKV